MQPCSALEVRLRGGVRRPPGKPFQGPKLPYLVDSKREGKQKTEEDRQKDQDWFEKREERRKTYTPASWQTYFRQCYKIPIRKEDSLSLWTSHSGDEGTQDLPFILMLHGGGFSGLTWAPMVDELSRWLKAEYGALDLRGHGTSQCADQNDLSLDVLVQDILDAIEWIKKGPINLGTTRRLILMGHSMGGALAVEVSLRLQKSDTPPNLCGLIVLDVVEGSAMAALSAMQFFLRSRPQEFKSMPEAIQWCVRSGQTKNLDSARISMGGQIIPGRTKFVSPHGSEEECDNNFPLPWTKLSPDDPNSVEVFSPDAPYPANADNYVWRIDLSKTEPYWRGWFEGLSAKFLEVKAPKLLMLAGVDRLDKALTVGQMQGKFQLKIFNQVGHCVQEDIPDMAAECVTGFLRRQLKLPTKIPMGPLLIT